MSLKHVILVSLANQPATGYDINAQFSGRLGKLWNTSHQAVYRALGTMQNEGLVAFTETQQSGKPDKKTYRITAAGRNHLDQWLLKQQPPSHLNEELMIKFYAGDLCPTAQLREQVVEHLNRHRHNLESLQSIEQQALSADTPRSAIEKIQHLTLRRGILTERARIDWCEEAIAILDSVLETEGA